MKPMNYDAIAIKKGIPIPPPSAFGRRGPLTNKMTKMEVGDCFDLPPLTPKERSDLYVRAKTAKIKITMRTMEENGEKLLRIWRTE